MADTEPQLEQENTEGSIKEENEEGSVHSGEELTEDAEALKEELSKIVVHPPTIDQ